MTPQSNDGRTAFEFTREEAWVAHAALLAASEEAVDGGDDAPPQLRPVRSIERERALDAAELELLRDALVNYLGEAPIRDRAPGRSLLEGIEETLEPPPRNA